MPLFDLRAGRSRGLRISRYPYQTNGILSATFARKLLLGLDLTRPSEQEVYSSLARLSAVTGRTFSEWYVCDITSGNLVGVAGTTLTNGGGSFLYRRTWPGWNGTDMVNGFKPIEFLGTGTTGQGFAGSTSLYNLSQSVTFVVNARLLRSPAAARTLFNKQASFAAAAPGFTIYISVQGQPILFVADGSTSSTAVGPSGIVGMDSLASGAPQWIAFKINLTAGNSQVLMYRNSGTAVNIPAGTKTNAVAFSFGGSIFNSCETLQVLQWGVLLGSEAESFTVDDLNELDNWCRVPSPLTGYVRQNITAPVVGRDSTGVRVQHCHGSTLSTTLTHFAHGYSANVSSDDAKLGAEFERSTAASSDTAATGLSKRNRLASSDNLQDAFWTKTNVTTTKNAGEDPGGFRGCALLAATADNGTVSQDYISEINEQHTHSVFVQRSGSSDVTGRLLAIRVDTSAVIAYSPFTASLTRERVSVKFTAPTTGSRFSVEVDTNGATLFATYAQAEYGTLTSYQPQPSGTLYDRDDVECYVDNSSGLYYDPTEGRVEATVCGYSDQVPSTGCFILSIASADGASNKDRHFIQRDALTSATQREARIYDSGSNIASMLDLPSVSHLEETTYASEWDAKKVMPEHGVRALADQDSTRVTAGTVTATGSWISGPSAVRVIPGARHNFLAHLEGIMRSLFIFGKRET